METFQMPITCKPTLAMGADSTSAPCLVLGNECYLAGPVPDLSYAENYKVFRKNIEQLLRRGTPTMVVCDLHPGYLSSAYAAEIAKISHATLVKVQHHRAHVASAAAEHTLKDYVGIACDGLGYGDDETLWGGEIFNGNERVGSLEPQLQLGGDSATIYPKKMLFGILAKFMADHELLQFYAPDEVKVFRKQLEQNYNVPQTTSAGRILDAVAALLGVCERRTFEGEPAIALEKYAATDSFDLEPVIQHRDRLILNTTVLFQFLIDNLQQNKQKLAATAHRYLASGLFVIAQRYEKPIVFSGGVAANKIISGYLQERGVLLHKNISAGDAGIGIGQAYLANL